MCREDRGTTVIAFQGNAFALSSDGLAKACNTLGVHAQELWTVLAVETSGCGFLPDRRPQILYERHIFHRLTEGRYDDGDISDPLPGGYGPPGAPQYDRLTRAARKDRNAALKSASWGIAQIMGENYVAAGFASVEEMVTAMSASEDQQVLAMACFLVHQGLHTCLQVHDWTSFARGYNGPNYVVNRYDVRLSGEFQKYMASALPDLNARAVQLYLTYLGFHPGPIDGTAGVQTLAAFRQFATERGLACNGSLGADAVPDLLSALAATS